eukprot:TRINITY_DN9152_c1_g1_i1.p1 TRINITY_DN9152_c1_g1~~TRINITY_DN9152_c1_g1_i1.p1  ORF type:complete len:353 (+),score=52.57 TRINITY_DN9152_c1_g1_i1:456-1514(+)
MKMVNTDSMSSTAASHFPVIDVHSLISLANASKVNATVSAIGHACREVGFFYVTQHGVETELQDRLETASKHFFALPLDEKMEIRMQRAGPAWRGYFPVGNELTSGKPDIKEGLYFAAELDSSDVRVRQQLPLHGSNQFPAQPAELRATVLEYMQAVTKLGHALLRGIALSLELQEDYFQQHYTAEPTTLFRIFNYPVPETFSQDPALYGVGEHTDYGLLTILKQDSCGGLQVKLPSGWVDAPVIEGAFVVNLGDMLDRITQGLYRSTPHRVRNTSGRARLSFPFFFDPGWDVVVRPIPNLSRHECFDQRRKRWDDADPRDFEGTYGTYLTAKVSKVFPDLFSSTVGCDVSD